MADYTLVRRRDPEIHDWTDSKRGNVSFRTLIDGGADHSPGIVQGVGYLPRGGSEETHWHEIGETLYVLFGMGVAIVDGEEMELFDGDTLYVPPRVPHKWAAPEEPMHFLYSFPAHSFDSVAYHFTEAE